MGRGYVINSAILPRRRPLPRLPCMQPRQGFRRPLFPQSPLLVVLGEVFAKFLGAHDLLVKGCRCGDFDAPVYFERLSLPRAGRPARNR